MTARVCVCVCMYECVRTCMCVRTLNPLRRQTALLLCVSDETTRTRTVSRTVHLNTHRDRHCSLPKDVGLPEVSPSPRSRSTPPDLHPSLTGDTPCDFLQGLPYTLNLPLSPFGPDARPEPNRESVDTPEPVQCLGETGLSYSFPRTRGSRTQDAKENEYF